MQGCICLSVYRWFVAHTGVRNPFILKNIEVISQSSASSLIHRRVIGSVHMCPYRTDISRSASLPHRCSCAAPHIFCSRKKNSTHHHHHHPRHHHYHILPTRPLCLWGPALPLRPAPLVKGGSVSHHHFHLHVYQYIIVRIIIAISTHHCNHHPDPRCRQYMSSSSSSSSSSLI